MVCRREARPVQSQALAACGCGVSDFPRLAGLDVDNCSVGEVNVEAWKVEVFDGFKLNGVTEEVLVDWWIRVWMAGCVRKCSLWVMKRSCM